MNIFDVPEVWDEPFATDLRRELEDAVTSMGRSAATSFLYTPDADVEDDKQIATMERELFWRHVSICGLPRAAKNSRVDGRRWCPCCAGPWERTVMAEICSCVNSVYGFYHDTQGSRM